jgi:16S rRNA (cytidine1402-2'-O)-methyltransferase
MTTSLYIVSTPIGNLQDITLRAIEVLKTVDIIACEDTRKIGLLLQNLKIPRRGKLVSYYEENETKRIPQIISELKNGKSVALVSNAGTPTISDPGFKLVRECVAQNIKVIPIPGPSAVLASLVASGFPTDKFLFLGYLPKKELRRKKLLERVKKIPFSCTLIFFESPKRIKKLLKEIQLIFGEIDLVLARELTKVFEEFLRGKPTNILKILEENPPKGEITVLLNIPPK